MNNEKNKSTVLQYFCNRGGLTLPYPTTLYSSYLGDDIIPLDSKKNLLIQRSFLLYLEVSLIW